MKYLVLQAACIECHTNTHPICGVSSYPIKTFSTLEEARKHAKLHPRKDGFVVIIDLVECRWVEEMWEDDE